MYFSRHKDKFPVEISEYFCSRWENKKIWRLEARREIVATRDLAWHLDYPFMSSGPPSPLFDLEPREVLRRPGDFPEHWRRVTAADLAFPIAVSDFGGRIVILDGIHRLIKAVDAGLHALECQFVSREQLRTASLEFVAANREG
jgi:hypothetical protein